MTTYTLTEAQLDSAISGKATALLKTLKPNLQESDAVVFQSAKNYDGEWSSIVITKTELQKETELYTHPAPMSKEDMVKVLGALVGADIALPAMLLGHSMEHAARQYAKRQEAITIMQSAIEGMK
jgi:hypothetical protein